MSTVMVGISCLHAFLFLKGVILFSPVTGDRAVRSLVTELGITLAGESAVSLDLRDGLITVNTLERMVTFVVR